MPQNGLACHPIVLTSPYDITPWAAASKWNLTHCLFKVFDMSTLKVWCFFFKCYTLYIYIQICFVLHRFHVYTQVMNRSRLTLFCTNTVAPANWNWDVWPGKGWSVFAKVPVFSLVATNEMSSSCTIKMSKCYDDHVVTFHHPQVWQTMTFPYCTLWGQTFQRYCGWKNSG